MVHGPWSAAGPAWRGAGLGQLTACFVYVPLLGTILDILPVRAVLAARGAPRGDPAGYCAVQCRRKPGLFPPVASPRLTLHTDASLSHTPHEQTSRGRAGLTVAHTVTPPAARSHRAHLFSATLCTNRSDYSQQLLDRSVAIRSHSHAASPHSAERGGAHQRAASKARRA